LLQIGILMHQARSGRLIVQLSQALQQGTEVVDERGRKLGRVVELIGPVKTPYASIALATSRFGRPGDKVFINR
jgi:RNA-binding protein